MSYDPGVVSAIRRIWQRRGLPQRYLTGAYDTGIVESGLRNLSGGDADSYGFRQQRASIYGRQPLNRQVNNLFNEFQQFDRGQPIGQLIADVQRPAAQYRGRYSQADVLARARALAGGGGGGLLNTMTGGGSISPTTEMPTQGPSSGNPFTTIAALQPANPSNPYSDIMQRGWNLLGQLWQKKYGDQGGGSGSMTAPSLPSFPFPSAGGGKVSGPYLNRIVQRANAVDERQLPYAWGGGHQGKVAAMKQAIPVDCSGAVSEVLGINPRVSGEFESWGRPGAGGNRGVTVYANKDHVLMKINGHFFGTSSANPGGGAGWIPAEHIGRGYLKGFTARHL